MKLRLPVVPGIEVEIGPSHAAPRRAEYVEIVAMRTFAVKEPGKFNRLLGFNVGQLPAEHSFGIVMMTLRIDPRIHVEDDARPAFLLPAGMSELQPQLRLADAAGANDDRQRAT